MCCFEFIGIVVSLAIVAKIAYNVWHFVYTVYVGPAVGANIDLRTCGPWAVVTGATDGIGKQYAFKLASKGLNVVLVSRNPTKLQNVAQEIEKRYTSVSTKTVAVDFTEPDATYTKLRAELSNMEIGILVNNVGMTSTNMNLFFETPDNDKFCRDIINCNVMSVARVTDIVLPGMILRKKGVILNVASLTAALPSPQLTIYGATKAFVDKFSRDLSLECEKHGVIVQTVLPGFVITNMVAGMRKSHLAPLPETFVECQLRTLGLENRTSGYWAHKIELYWFEMVSFFFPTIVGRVALQKLTEMRNRALRRQAAKAKKQ